MDSVIQMLPASLRKFSTHIDFQGQYKAERIFQVVLTISGIIGFIVGYIMQQLSVTMYSVGIGFLLSCVLILPPWSLYRRNPLKWQPNVEETESEETKKKEKSKAASSSQPKKAENKKRR